MDFPLHVKIAYLHTMVLVSHLALSIHLSQSLIKTVQITPYQSHLYTIQQFQQHQMLMEHT